MGNAAAQINNNYKRIYGGDLNFPSDVGALERTGHYVQFFINVQEQTKVQFPKGSFNVQTGAGSTASRESSTLTVTRNPTKRLASSIQLYMPNKLSVDSKANYTEEEIGAVLGGGSAIVGKAISGDWTWGGLWEGIKQGASNLGTSALETAGATGAKAMANIKSGQITNNRTEMKFEGLDRRSFSFSFKMMPRNEAETKNIKNIVDMFRFHSMPEFLGDANSSRTLISPSTFDIKYMHKGGENTYMNKISTCVLESVQIEYGGDRTQFFKNNAPTEVNMTLQFKELEMITKERIADGY
jgi:hypothetical protein